MKQASPNIVYVVSDQWRGDCLNLYGNRHPVMTPHMNQLAAEGALFSQAYADCPICMPQRVTMLTGRTASQLRSLNNFSKSGRPDFDFAETLPARLARECGYQTKAVGKMHFAPARSRYGFEHVALHPDDYICWLEENGYGGAFRGHGLGGNEVYPVVAQVPERYHHTTWIVNEAVRFLDQRDPEVPFLLFVVFEAPHSPFDPPPPYDRMYDNFTIPEPVMGDWCKEESYPVSMEMRRVRSKLDQLSPEMIRESRRRYYGQVSHIDYQLGRLFGAIRQRGLDDETAIVFTADHGECLGDHGLYGKYCFLQSSARVPLILRPPRTMKGLPRSIERQSPVMTADICPTLLELAGLNTTPEVEGQSLVPLIRDETIFEQRVLFGETRPSVCALNSRHKYIFYRKGGQEQLFDLREDPDDLSNLIGDATQSDAATQLKSELCRYLERNGSEFVRDGALDARDGGFDYQELRAGNPLACRGPMRWGMGY